MMLPQPVNEGAIARHPGETGVVIVTWNNSAILENCFRFLSEQTQRGFFVCVVDNGSGDETTKTIENYRSTVEAQVLVNGRNHGFAKSNNQGIARLLSEHPNIELIALLNDDIEIQPDWFEKMTSYMREHSNIGIAQGANYTDREMSTYDSTGIYLEDGLVPRQRGYSLTDPQLERTSIGPNAAAVVLRRSFIQDLSARGQLFDELFFAYVEDVDLLLRSFSRSWEHGYVPEAKAVHLGSSTGNRIATKKMFWGARNLVWLLAKNAPIKILARQRRQILAGHSLSLQILSEQGRSVLNAYLFGIIVGIATSPLMWGKRWKIAKRRKIEPDDYFKILVPVDHKSLERDPFMGWFWILTVPRSLQRFLRELADGTVKEKTRVAFVNTFHCFFHNFAVALWRMLPRSVKDTIKKLLRRK